jgi:hypothetical protein
MARARLRFLSCLLAAVLCFPFPTPAFDTPLSDTAVRQAYFLGQRHDETYGRFMDSYVRHLAPPESGPYVSSVAFYTPYALIAQLSSQHPNGYSAQQAQIDHQNLVETVKVEIDIQLTKTYGPVMPNPTGRTSGTPWDYVPRPPDFWRDFQIQVVSNGKAMIPFSVTGIPNYFCGGNNSLTIAAGQFCCLTGATVQMEFLADTFTSDTATVQIARPDSDPILVNFELYDLR